MADVDTAPAESQAVVVLYCGGMFIVNNHNAHVLPPAYWLLAPS